MNVEDRKAQEEIDAEISKHMQAMKDYLDARDDVKTAVFSSVVIRKDTLGTQNRIINAKLVTVSLAVKESLSSIISNVLEYQEDLDESMKAIYMIYVYEEVKKALFRLGQRQGLTPFLNWCQDEIHAQDTHDFSDWHYN